jgi:hypothetical protein
VGNSIQILRILPRRYADRLAPMGLSYAFTASA